MDKEQILEQIEEIDYTLNSLSHTIEYLQSCILEILKQKEGLTHELQRLSNKRKKVGFTKSE